MLTKAQISACVAAATIAGCVPAIQPLLLSSLADAGQITQTQIGQASTTESLGMVIATLVAGAWARPDHLKRTLMLAAGAMLLANAATPHVAVLAIFGLRFANGLASGVILWAFIGLLQRSLSPGRLFGIYVTVQSVLAFALSLAIGAWLVPRFGAAGGYGALLGLSGLAFMLTLFVADSYEPIAGADSRFQWPTPRGAFGLLAIMLFMAGVFATWIYFVPLARVLGYGEADVHQALSAAVGVQILGATLSIGLADRWRAAHTAITTAVIGIMAVALLAWVAHTWALYSAIGVLAFVWMFAPAFHLPMLGRIDSTGKSGIFLGTAQIGGVCIGPFVASMIIAHHPVIYVVSISAAMFAASAFILLLVSRKQPGEPL